MEDKRLGIPSVKTFGKYITPTRDRKNFALLENLCGVQTPLKHGISKVYGILAELEGQESPPYIGKWEKEIGTKLEDQ